MKYLRDRSTVELLETPPRGRPRKDSAKSGAQRQKEYRARKKPTRDQLLKIKQLVAQIDALTAKKSQLQSEHDLIPWGPNMERSFSALGRQLGNEARALSKAIDLLRAEIVSAAMAAYSCKSE